MTEVSKATRFHAVSWWGSVMGLGNPARSARLSLPGDTQVRRYPRPAQHHSTADRAGSTSPGCKAYTWRFNERASRTFRRPANRPLA